MPSLKQFAKDTLRALFYRGNYHVSQATDPARLREFFAMVRPQTTDRELIRVGGPGDGGYLIPQDLSGVDVCFSPGVSTVADFERDLASRGIKCYLADFSVDAPPVANELFDFEKKFLGTRNDDVFITLEDWVQRKAGVGNDHLLQMDIEGAEYPVILDSSRELLKRFRIIVIEFHGLDALFDAAGFDLINLTFVKLLRDFELVHIHPNNIRSAIRHLEFEVPPIMEFTFLRKDRITLKQLTGQFPHHLDRRNVDSMADLVLPQCWYVRAGSDGSRGNA